MSIPRSTEQIKADLAAIEPFIDDEAWPADRDAAIAARLAGDVGPLLEENERLGEELSAAGYHEEAATVERDAALADLAHLRDQIRELAELYLYDGDTDQPFSDAYGAFHDLAAAVPSPAVTPEAVKEASE